MMDINKWRRVRMIVGTERIIYCLRGESNLAPKKVDYLINISVDHSSTVVDI